jgi:nucleotide-binding universal stress UspA family protein
MNGQGAIVVGVDGSDQAKAALRWAVDQARRTGQRVRVVSAWRVPALMYAGAFETAADLDPRELERVAGETLEEAVGELGDAADGVEIERCVRQGQAADVLVEESQDADLLVVGSRGLGGFRELLLGSVSHQCSQHATCPVLIIRPSGG